MESPESSCSFIDIGANLTDACFRGVFYGKKVFEDDFEDMMKRSRSVGVTKFMVTVGSLHDFEPALKLAKEYPGEVYITCGVHPTRSKELKNPNVFGLLKKRIAENKYKGSTGGVVVAYGEFGLDYDRLNFADKECQKKAFSEQLILAQEIKLPLFLHCRSAIDDFIDIMRPHKSWIKEVGGVCHCFTASKADAEKIMEFGLDIGLTGLSFKEPGFRELIEIIPLNRLHLETDAPYCSIRPSFAGGALVSPEQKKRFKFYDKERYGSLSQEERLTSMVKGRNEPAYMETIASCVALVKKTSLKTVADAAYNNTMNIYFAAEKK